MKYELAYDGLALIWHLHSCGLKPWRTQIKHSFCYFVGFGLNVKS